MRIAECGLKETARPAQMLGNGSPEVFFEAHLFATGLVPVERMIDEPEQRARANTPPPGLPRWGDDWNPASFIPSRYGRSDILASAMILLVCNTEMSTRESSSLDLCFSVLTGWEPHP